MKVFEERGTVVVAVFAKGFDPVDTPNENDEES